MSCVLHESVVGLISGRWFRFCSCGPENSGTRLHWYYRWEARDEFSVAKSGMLQ